MYTCTYLNIQIDMYRYIHTHEYAQQYTCIRTSHEPSSISTKMVCLCTCISVYIYVLKKYIRVWTCKRKYVCTYPWVYEFVYIWRERRGMERWGGGGWRGGGFVVCWLFNVPATCECISGTDLLRQVYVLPHWDRTCRSNFLLTQSQYTDTGPTIPNTDPITPGAWQGNHWSASFEVTGMTRPRKIPARAGFEPGIFRSQGRHLNH